ncbi:MAG: class C beta-lactamase-related serine hydrolase [Candidatus Heimdallarchaeota archaeon]|nr:class C beta-lactamase-related serine hydrolase [Candidatus Heimdallarchaeota archaeon]
MLILLLPFVLSSQIFSFNSFATHAQAIWPTVDWERTAPSKVHMKLSKLNDMINYIEEWNEHYFFSNIDSILIVKDGYLILEEYFGLWNSNDVHVQWSVTKSVTSALIGIAIKKGYIQSINEKVLNFFQDCNISNVDYRKEAITIEHLLMMSTGLAYPGDDAIWTSWMNAPNQVQHILDLPMAQMPGTIFNYDTGGSHLLSAIIEKTTNMSTLEFAEENLFSPLGITHYYWLFDKQGINFGGHGLHLEPQDMAKFGYLYLNYGIWDNEQILPIDWVINTTQTKWSFNNQWGYAEQWWKHPHLNAYTALGRYGQRITVIPDKNLIVVFTGTISDADSEPHLEIIENYIIPALNYNRYFISLIGILPIVIALPYLIILLYNRKKRKES